MYKISELPKASIRCWRVLTQHNNPLKVLSAVALAALALLMLAGEAKAQDQEAIPTLEGETFSKADILSSTISCAPDPNSPIGEVRIDFSIFGIATGPGSGIFNEIGFITFDPISGLVGNWWKNILFCC